LSVKISSQSYGPDALARCIAELRSILGDKSQSPIYIETIPRHGYRFIAELKPKTQNTNKRILVLSSAFTVMLVFISYWWLQPNVEDNNIDWRNIIAHSVRVTAKAEMEIQPELSSNGRSLTYSKKEKDTFVIKVVDLTGKQKFHISAPGSHLLSAVLSPSEDRILAIEYGNKDCKVVLFNLPELSKQELSDCALPNSSSALE
jgi:Tol biopolymer transport system component